MDKHPITREGYDKLKDEIRRLENDEMPKIAQAIADARAEGDLRENAEYHGQREEQGRLQAKINSLKAKLASCVIVEKSSQPKGQVAFGSRVTVKDLKYGDIEHYEFVGPGEENYDGDVMKILTTSPMAQAMMAKKVGDVVEFDAPRGKQRYEITEIGDAE
jgi:transcription elongation factor GreA